MYFRFHKLICKRKVLSAQQKNVSLAGLFPCLNDSGFCVEEIEDLLIQKIRGLDKLVDEPAKGKSMEKVLRSRQSL